MEEPKRLAPTFDTTRELYLKSGNECAFPGCNRRIIDSEGNLVGEICHIEAAMPDGPRFNPKQTNEERRSFGNLILLCHDHHVATHNEEKFSVTDLKTMKAEHETKFTDTVRKILESVTDYSDLEKEHYPKSLNILNKLLDWRQTETELQSEIDDIIPLVGALKRIPRQTRSMLAIIFDRAGLLSEGLAVPCAEIEKACRLSLRELDDHLVILKRYKIVVVECELRDREGIAHIKFCSLDSGWSIWEDLKKISQVIPMEKVIVDLRFDLLD